MKKKTPPQFTMNTVLKDKIVILSEFYGRKDKIMLAIAYEAKLPYERIDDYLFKDRNNYSIRINTAIDGLIAKLTQKEAY